MMKMMRTMVKKAISIFLVVQVVILATMFFSTAIFANVEVAFLSAFFVIIGSSFAYKKMVVSQVDSEAYEERDLLDEIEDPHELYENVNDEAKNQTPVEELDLKQIVKEEKAKIKTFSLSSIKHGARGSVSFLRLVPYIFLILGFIALKNNDALDLSLYLPSLLIGIVVGSIVSKDIVS
ncbi:MAG: hypothetical protein U9O86_03590 [Campylobacterota bacterium]|nr:hypothetical protein [Campylobacterota bacterium]